MLHSRVDIHHSKVDIHHSRVVIHRSKVVINNSQQGTINKVVMLSKVEDIMEVIGVREVVTLVMASLRVS